MKFPSTLNVYTKSDIESHIHYRNNEQKLGETISFLDFETTPRFALLGVPEDFGVQANHGRAGTREAWNIFLDGFLNMQHNEFLRGEDILLLGHIKTDDLSVQYESLDTQDFEALGELVTEVDNRLTPVIQTLILNNIIPIVIGGGHNNAYGCLKGASQALQHPIQALNIDPHADFRLDDWRHSGNGFRFAFEEGYLEKYFIWGLHQEYNNQTMLDTLRAEKKNIAFNFFDELHKPNKHKQELQRLNLFFDPRKPVALEIDLDSMAYFPVGAFTPFGFSLLKIHQYILHWSTQFNVPYLHLAESAPLYDLWSRDIIKKSLAYLVSGFIRNHSE